MKNHMLFVLLLSAAALSLSAQQRIILVEQFTNSGCPPCASSTPPVLQYVSNNPATTVAVAYHTSFPYNDSMYFENPAESNARVSLYGVVSVPHTVLDGNQFSGSSSSFLPNMAGTITNRAAVPAPYAISSTGAQIAGNTLQGMFVFTSLQGSNATDSLIAHLVVIEKEVQKSAYLASPGNNTETVYQYVMRKMLPASTGTPLVNRQLNGMDTIPFTWNMQHIKSIAEVRVVAFVQNTTTNEVYMAVMADPNDITGTNEPADTPPGFNLYPVPASGLITATTTEPFTGTISVTDVTGRTASPASLCVENATTISIPLTGLAPGIYFVVFKDETREVLRKILVN